MSLFTQTYILYGISLLLIASAGGYAIAKADTDNEQNRERIENTRIAVADYDLDTSSDPDDEAGDYHNPDSAGGGDDD